MDGSVADRDRSGHLDDEHGWLLQQAAVLRGRQLAALDADHLAEFLEDMARRDVREGVSQLERLYLHLLKFAVQPSHATRSWARSVMQAQNALADLLESATLRREVEARMPIAWERARRAAATETGMPLAAMPAENPWPLDDALSWTPPVDLPARTR